MVTQDSKEEAAPAAIPEPKLPTPEQLMTAFKSDLKDATDEFKGHQSAIKQLEVRIEQLKGGIYALGLLIPKKKETPNG